MLNISSWFRDGSTVAYRFVLSTHNQRVVVSNPLGAYAPRQGILSILSRSRCGEWGGGGTPGIYSLNALSAERSHGQTGGGGGGG